MPRRLAGAHVIAVAPEVKEVEPVVRIAATVLLQQRRVAATAAARPLRARRGSTLEKSASFSNTTWYRLPPRYRPIMKITGRRRMAAARMADGSARGWPRNRRHVLASSPRVRSPRRRRTGPGPGTPGSCNIASMWPSAMISGLWAGLISAEHGIHLARVVLVHGHRDAQSRLALPDGADDFEAADMRTHQECAVTGSRALRTSSSPSTEISNRSVAPFSR